MRCTGADARARCAGGFRVPLAEDLLPHIYSLAKGNRTDAVPCHRIFESLARYALPDPASTKNGGGGGGVRVVFNLA